MPFQACPDICSIAIRGLFGGKPTANVLHAHKTGGYTLADLTAVANAVDLAVAGSLIPLWCADFTYSETEAHGLALPIDLSFTSNISTGPGTHTGGSAPGNVAFVVTERTGFTGRSARGRIYQGPVPFNVNTSINNVSTAYSTAVVAAWVQVGIAIQGAGWTHVVLSRRAGGAPRTVGIGTAVNQLEARNTELDSMRSRLPAGH
jgi:hypothetical protein